MKRNVFFKILTIVALGLLPVLLGPSVAHAGLEAEVQKVLGDKLLANAHASIEFMALAAPPGRCAILFKHNAETPLVPASNLKLITTSAALEKLGADFKFRTLLVQRGDDLILVGDGDPSFGDSELLKKSGWDATTVYRQWADGLKKKGITSINNVIVDDSVFEDTFVHPHWPGNQLQKRYEAPVSGMNLNANCVDFHLDAVGSGHAAVFSLEPPTHYVTILRNTCVGGENSIDLARKPGSNEIVLAGQTPANAATSASITIFDPPLFAATALSETLAANGIKVVGAVTRDRTIRTDLARKADDKNSPYILLAVHETPIAQVMARANKDSMNLYAECLGKRLAFAVAKAGSWENGTAAVGSFVKDAGVPDSEFHLDDGCGLSKENTISANAIAHVLAHEFISPNFQAFLASLSVAGSDGTLERRFGTAATHDLRGRVFGKSGFVEGDSALSGYLHGRDDKWYAFSILFNGIPHESNSAIKPLQDQLIKDLDMILAAP